EEAVPVPAPWPQADDEDRHAGAVPRAARPRLGDRSGRRGRDDPDRRVPRARPLTLEAYCWPPSGARNEAVGLRVSTDAPWFDVVVAREGAASEPVWGIEQMAARSHETPVDASSNGCGWPTSLEIPVRDWRSGYYSVTVTAGGRRVPGRSTRSLRPRADPAGALDDDLARVQRLGRALAVHGRDARVVRAPARQGLPGQARADRPDDAARARPGSDGVPHLGPPTRPVGLVRRGRLVHLRADLHALGRGDRVSDRRRDLAGPRATPD